MTTVDDKTIVKPRPGMRGMAGKASVKATKQEPTSSDKTRVFTAPETKIVVDNILTISGNPLVDHGGNILSICGQLRIVDKYDDVEQLRYRCIELIKNYEHELRLVGICAETIQSARYCLCCFIDETVLNSNWGNAWSKESLLSTFHSETFGGEYFYTLADNMLEQANSQYQLLELMYLCLTLGFMGKMRFENQGERKLEDYRDKMYLAVKNRRGEIHRELSPNWKEKVVQGSELQESFPIWVIISLFAAVLLLTYMSFSYNINQHSANVYDELTQLVPWKKQNVDSTHQSRKEFVILQQHLQTEIERKLLIIDQLNDVVRIRIGAGDLFASGSAEPREDFEVVLAKIARVLESTSGKILITGHTDDEPTFSTRYPSNWHLSLSRATSIANVLANSAALSGRLWPEGRGATEPIVTNDNKENRAINRRIEIDLLF